MHIEEHKSKRRDASYENLGHYQDKEESSVESIVSRDESWVYEFIPESKKKFHDLRNILIHPLKEFKIQPSEKIKMMTVFWDCEGILLCEFLPSKYCETLEKLHETIKRKRSGLANCWSEAAA
jgi:hypothetical protein